MIFEILQYQFMQNAFIVGILISITCALLGIFLILRKYSMLSDGLSHVGFASITIALFLSLNPYIVSIPLVIFSAILILKINEKLKIHGDTAIALISSSAIAFGLIFSSMSSGFNVNINNYLFGSILTLTRSDVILSASLMIIVLLFIIIFYRHLLVIFYDPEFSQVIGIKHNTINYAVIVLISLTIIIGTKLVGALLISSLIVFPTVIAIQISKSFKSTIILAGLIASINSIIAIFLSYLLTLPTGASIVILNMIVLIIILFIKNIRRFL